MRNISFIICLLTLLLYSKPLQAQHNPSANPDSLLIKGFYKNYQEFVNRSPSILLNFSTRLYTAGKEDSTIVRAEYTVIDTTEMFGDFWGFCDGTNIFVASGGFLKLKYWKLQCEGPNPYLFYKKNSVFPGVAGVVTAAIVAALPNSFELMFIDNDGRPREMTEYNLKRLFKDNKQLLKEYRAEIYPTVAVDLSYLLRYNASKMKQ